MTVLLDTTVLIDLLRGRQERCTLVRDLALAGHAFAISAINLGEVYAGLRPGEERATEQLLAGMTCHAVTASIAQRAGELRSSFRRVGVTLALADMIVAATAIEHRLTLMTDNVKDFPIPALRLYTRV